MTGSPQRLTFSDRVIVVTGAGRGVGRAHALAFAERGAAVVVNDLGGSMSGRPGQGEPVADVVVEEIERHGGRAVADSSDVSTEDGASQLVRRALDSFGRVDVVVNNAGIDRSVKYADITTAMLQRFHEVHVLGTHLVTAAAWPHLVAQGFGRVVTTTSSVGFFGGARALPYAMAKGAVNGLTQALAVEGARHGITVNSVAPFAASRLATDRLQGSALLDAMDQRAPASQVSPLVVWLAHPSTDVTGMVFEVGGGAVSRLVVGASHGLVAEGISPELLRDNAEALLDTSRLDFPPPGGGDRLLLRHVLGAG